jgi:hypothetical protein
MYEILPDYSKLEWIHDITDSMVVIAFVSAAYFSSFDSVFLLQILAILFLRGIFVNLTILPKIKDCDNEFKFKNYITGNCFDKIFSGHLAVTIVSVYTLYILFGMPVFFIGYTGILSFLILLHRSHYTVDLAVAVLASILTITFIK